MAKHYPGEWVIRSMLFTPGHNEPYILKALKSKADLVVLDLEDAVPETNKADARDTIRKVLQSGEFDKQPVFVRVNPMETGHTLMDLDVVACRKLAGFIYPKAYSAQDIKVFSAQLALKEMALGLENCFFDIIVLMETPQSILDAYAIASSSKRVKGLLFGCEDYLTDMRGSHGPDGRSLLVPRHIVAMAARAAGIVPIDTPFVKVGDQDGLRDHIIQARELGFEGMLVMSPSQVDVANEMYTPSDAEVEQALNMIELSASGAQTQKGISVKNNIFISPPTLRRSRGTVKRREVIREFEEFKRGV